MNQGYRSGIHYWKPVQIFQWRIPLYISTSPLGPERFGDFSWDFVQPHNQDILPREHMGVQEQSLSLSSRVHAISSNREIIGSWKI